MINIRGIRLKPEDKALVHSAKRLGFKVIEPEDIRSKQPNSFSIGNRLIWKTPTMNWACAEMVDKLYINQRYYVTLRDALNQEGNNATTTGKNSSTSRNRR